MARNTLIRDPGDTSPFTKLEVRILNDLYGLMKGEYWEKGNDRHFGKLDEIKEIYGLSRKEAMYIAALYQDNFITGQDFSDYPDPVEVPLLNLYDITYHQDVTAWRDVYFTVYASNDDMADMAASHDFYEDDNIFSEEMAEGDIGYGDYGDVYDSTIEISDKDPSEFGDTFRRNESKNIIKKILNEYRRKI